MIYNKELINRNLNTVTKIYNINRKTEEEYSEIEKEIESIRREKEETLQILAEEKKQREEYIEKEIDLKMAEFTSKAEETIKVKNQFNEIIEKTQVTKYFMDEHYEHFYDNKERFTREAAKVNSKLNLEDLIIELNQVSTKLKTITERQSEISSKVSKFFSILQDKLIEAKEHMGGRELVAFLIVSGIIIFNLSKMFMRSSILMKVVYVVLTIGLTVVTIILKNHGGRVNKDIIYKTYNLIDIIQKQSKLNIVKVDTGSQENTKKAKELLDKVKEKKKQQIDEEYNLKINQVTGEYEEQLEILENQSKLDLDSLKIDITLDEYSGNKVNENVPIIGTTDIQENPIEIYYTGNSILYNYEEDVEPEEIRNLMQGTIVELLRSEDLGKINIKLVDTVGLGKKFNEILKLQGIKTDTGASILDNKIYTTEDQLQEMMNDCIKKISSRILQILPKGYKNIHEYNDDNKKNKLNYEFVFMYDADKIQDNKIQQQINKILKDGNDCGVVIILSGKDVINKYKDTTERFKGVDIINVNRRIELKTYNNTELNIEINSLDYTHKLEQLYEEAYELSNRSIDFIDMMPTEIWQDDPSEQLQTLLGVKENGRHQTSEFGGTGTTHHALLGGTTGSGKTSFIHTFIISSCLKYSPELLEFVLIDFKQGVEFQLYADYELPHARFLGLESDREYALNILKYIKADIDRRSSLCKEHTLADLTSYNKFVEANGNKVPKMKRTIIIIDEFQELLRGQDNIEQETRFLLEYVARIGRSFGVHLVLSSQSMAGIPGGLGNLASLFSIRIALKCDEDTSRSILSNNNTAAAHLDKDKKGQGIYNDDSGNINSNSKFTFGYINDEQRITYLTKLRDTAKEKGYVTKTNIFYKSKIRNIKEVEWFNKKLNTNPEETNILLGDSSALTKSYVDITLKQQSTENILIITGEKSTTDGILNTILKSIYHSKGENTGEEISEETKAKIIIVDCNINKTPEDSKLPNIPGIEQRVFGFKDAEVLISNIYDIIEERKEVDDSTELYPIYFIIINTGKIRSLTLDSYSSETTKLMQDILANGPYLGIHTITIFDTYKSLNKTRAKILDESSHRLVGTMNDMDSSMTINDKRASSLDKKLELIYYNDNSDEYEKVRLLQH